MAINIKKATINIYSQIYKSFIKRFHGVLSEVINEEKKHLEILTDIKNKLKSQQ